MSKPIKAITFDVFGTLLAFDEGCPWVARYVHEVKAIEKCQKPYRTLDVIFGEIDADVTGLRVRPGVVDALKRLCLDYLIAPLSNANSSPALSDAISDHFGLPWSSEIDIAEARAYKPDPAVYRLAMRRLGLEAGQILHVASHPYDLRAAKAAGFRTAYLAWPGYAEPAKLGDFDYTATSLSALADELT